MKPELNTLTETQRKISKENYLKSVYWEEFDPERVGVFAIYGDDQTGSYASSHTPLLAVFIGKMGDALDFAVTLRFWTYWSNTGYGFIREIPSNL